MKKKAGTYILLGFLVCVFITTAIISSNTGEVQKEVSPTAEAVWYNEPHNRLYGKSGEVVYVSDSDEEKYKENGYSEKIPEHEGLSDLKDSIESFTSSRSGDWGVYVKNLRSNEYLAINEKDYSAASLIKLFTAAAVYNELEAGTLKATYDIYEAGADKAYDDISYNLRIMLCESDNHACNYLTRKLGGGSAANGFDVENRHTESLGCENTAHKSEIVDGGSITVLGHNQTSPRDCGIVLERIYRGTLVSPTASASFLDLLMNQERVWKIPHSLPDDVQTANKTGETDTTEGDAAIVYSPACNYIICVIGNGNVSGGVDTIRTVSKMVYDYFNNEINEEKAVVFIQQLLYLAHLAGFEL